MSVPLINTDSP